MPPGRSVTRIVDVAASTITDDFNAALSALAAEAAVDREGPLQRSLRAVADLLPVLVWSADGEGRFTACFGGAMRRLGMSEADMLATSIRDWGPEAAGTFERALAGEATSFAVEGEAEGDPWAFAIIAQPVADGSGVVSVSIDITEQLVGRRTNEEVDARRRESEERFRLVAEHAPLGIFMSDGEGNITYANPVLVELTGRTADELIEAGWADAVHPDDLPAIIERQAVARTEENAQIDEFRVVRPDGTVRWLRVRVARRFDEDGAATLAVGTAADVTEFVQAQQRLQESEERTRAILETAAEGIITADERGIVIEFNAAAERILGYDSEEVVGRTPVDQLIAPAQRDLLMGYFTDYLSGASHGLAGSAPVEVEVVRKDGSTVPVEVALTEVQTSEGRLFTAVVHDISERRAFELELEHQATHDALTGLPNRALLVAELEAALNRAARRQSDVGVLFIELERFKVVTGSLGHRAGDQLIREAARRIVEVVGSAGTVTRFGGVQFVAFVEDLGGAVDLATLGGEVIDALERPFLLGAEEAFIKASVGISFAPRGVGVAEALIANADIAMNRAKARDGAGLEVFDAEMRAWVDRRRTLEIALRHGIDRGEFELYYQPVVTVAEGVVRGFEALIRWNHPQLGLLPPSEFIPLAEDSGLIVPLGEWILQEACRQLATWQAAFPGRPLQVSVNLSGRQLALPDLADVVAGALECAGADPGGLDIELTETVLLGDVDHAARALDQLKAIGVKLAMDDFGTGYSSLTYLARLPIDIVKVDRSFVSQIGTPSRDASIVSLVVGLAQTLQLDVVAEGVETPEQLRVLEDLDCSYAQGYFFSKPQPASVAEGFLSEPLLLDLRDRS